MLPKQHNQGKFQEFDSNDYFMDAVLHSAFLPQTTGTKKKKDTGKILMVWSKI